MKVNKKLLPIKLHYFLFNAGMGCLVPFLSTIIRQMGFTPSTVGMIYAALSVFGLGAKPLLNGLQETSTSHKSIFIIFQLITTVSLAMIYFVPRLGSYVTVNLDCYGGLLYLKSCPAYWMVDLCKVQAVSDIEDMAMCHMNCDMTSTRAWHAICEYWRIPEYCNTKVKRIDYTAHLGTVTRMDKCAFISANNITLDGHIFTPHCRGGGAETCRLNCDDDSLSGVVGNQSVTMTCLSNRHNYRICGSETILSQLPNKISSECKVSCYVNPWRLLQICEGWKSDDTETCRARKKIEDRLPTNLSLIGFTQLSSTSASTKDLDVCVYTEISTITLPGSYDYHSSCSKEMPFQIPCETRCDNDMLDEIFLEASGRTMKNNKQLFFLIILMIYGWVGQITVVTIADTMYFNLLGQEVPQYGTNRLWGSVGRGISALTTGILIDALSDSDYKDYTVAFVLMLVFMIGDVIVTCFLEKETTVISNSFQTAVDTRVFSMPSVIFIIWAISVGLCSGLCQFTFWYLDDIASIKDAVNSRCNGPEYIKTLQGLVSAIQTFCGELPFAFGFIKRFSHLNVMSVVLVTFGGRFILYSLLKNNPWWVLPIELLHSDTGNIFHDTMASFVKVVSPSGTENTVLSSIGVVSEAVVASLGSLIGGFMYEGLWRRGYFFFGIGSLVNGVILIVLQLLVKDNGHSQPNEKTEIDGT